MIWTKLADGILEMANPKRKYTFNTKISNQKKQLTVFATNSDIIFKINASFQ